ncbi:MAG: hypothetical protein C0501_17435 [Isosphaera sp.]|nr:hypothetical protein [Isosphaera sp.]
MSTALHDLASAAVAAAGLYPDTRTSSPTGPAVDLIAADGPCFAVQLVGDFTGDSLAGRVEQSADGSTGWATVPGAEFAAVTAANNVQVIRFARSLRYVRYAATLAGISPSVKVAAVIGEQKKTL